MPEPMNKLMCVKLKFKFSKNLKILLWEAIFVCDFLNQLKAS